MSQLSYFITFLLLFIQFTSFSQAIELKNESKIPMDVTANMELFKDSTAKLSFDQIRSAKFVDIQKDHFIFPYSDDIFWVKLNFKNINSLNKNWVLKWNNPMIEQLDFYLSDSLESNYSHTFKKLYTYQKLKKLYEEEPSFEFNLTPNSSKTLYIKITSQRGHRSSITLHSEASFIKFRYDNFAEQGFYNGLIIFRLFLVIALVFFIAKDLKFRIYSLQITLKSAAFWGLQNILGPIFTNDPIWALKVNFIGVNSSTIGSAMLTLVLLEMKKIPKIATYLLYLFLGISFLLNLIVCFDYQWYWLKAGVYNSTFCSIFVLLLFIYCLFKRLSINIYYSIPFLMGVISYLLINLRILVGFDIKPLFTIASLLFLGEIFVFVIFLGQIIRRTELNKLLAEQKLSFNIEQNARLKELDNLKTTFFTNISHELRTPLTLITVPIQELLAKYPTDNLLPLINRNANRLLALVNQLLDISKLEAKQMNVEVSQNDISKYVKTLISSFTSLAESRQIKFNFVQNKSDVVGYFDKDKLEKIITNLLSNAFKFTANGGSVSVRNHFSDNTNRMKIEITDTGLGIAEEQLDKIFDRFYQIDSAQNRNFEGTGIGLALVKELVEVLKGEITVSSKKNEGTTFTVSLPIDFETWKDNIVETDETSKIESKTPIIEQTSIENLSNKQIHKDEILLIVDDNEDIRTYIRSIFEQDYQIIEAINGVEGLQKAIEKTPDLIISDLMMPLMDGFDFCKHLKTDEKTSHIPIVMLTAKANIESRVEGLELGADDYLLKPFNRNEIKARVKNLIEKQEKLRQYFSGKIIELKPNEIKVNSRDEVFIEKVKQIIKNNIADSSFTAEGFANEMNMSQSQLLRKLKALTSMSINEFIRDFRLQRAADLLAQKSATVSEIAFAVGFESLSYFTKIFKEKYGKLPSEFTD